MVGKYDFSGYATRNDLRCSDGRTIRRGAFQDCDGLEVPLVWQHQHNDPKNVIGHAVLENRNDGVYTYGVFNNSEMANDAKEAVKHGDIRALSIYANGLVENKKTKEVFHGTIREVSLVLAGANPGAYIDNLAMAHGLGEDADLEEAIIYTDDEIELAHADDGESKEAPEPETKEKENDMAEKTVKDVIDSMTEEQKNVLYALVGQALEDKDSDGEDENMKHNVFEAEELNNDALMHDAMNTIISDAKRFGSLKESFLQHAEEYGIRQIDWLFPEAQSVTGDAPQFINTQPNDWVQTVMNGVHHTPFSRIKMMFADITEDEARAKGYLKGKLKKEEVFGLLRRTVDPCTVYKKQKLDRDDVIDITDFDVVSWLKQEMRLKLNEELARAYIFGDGRSTMSEDKISETNIIPVWKDADLYTIKHPVTPKEDESLEHAIINGAVIAQDEYEGSGNITLFMTNTYVTRMLLMEDGFGHRLYKNVSELANAMSVDKIAKVPASIMPEGIYAIGLDLKDYNVGADKGGAINMFDDFDIDYNQQKYLIETRCSGALTTPHAAFVLKANA